MSVLVYFIKDRIICFLWDVILQNVSPTPVSVYTWTTVRVYREPCWQRVQVLSLVFEGTVKKCLLTKKRCNKILYIDIKQWKNDTKWPRRDKKHIPCRCFCVCRVYSVCLASTEEEWADTKTLIFKNTCMCTQSCTQMGTECTLRHRFIPYQNCKRHKLVSRANQLSLSVWSEHLTVEVWQHGWYLTGKITLYEWCSPVSSSEWKLTSEGLVAGKQAVSQLLPWAPRLRPRLRIRPKTVCSAFFDECKNIHDNCGVIMVYISSYRVRRT